MFRHLIRKFLKMLFKNVIIYYIKQHWQSTDKLISMDKKVQRQIWALIFFAISFEDIYVFD